MKQIKQEKKKREVEYRFKITITQKALFKRVGVILISPSLHISNIFIESN